ncbi:uncharacterized protein ACRADG_009034 [Cochliomyia hominivorax]
MKILGLKKPLLFLNFTIFLMIIKAKTSSASAIEEVLSIAKGANDIIKVVEEATITVAEIWNITRNISPESSDSDSDLSLILSRLDDISEEIKLIGKRNSQPVNNLNHMRLIAKQHDIINTMNAITSRFGEYQQYVKYRNNVENLTLLNFAEWTALPNGFSVHHLMNRLHLTMFGADDMVKRPDSNIFETMVSNYGDEDKCLCQQSTQQFIYSLYTDIALTELKAYMMLEFSWIILRAFGKGNFTKEAEIMRDNYKKRSEKTKGLLSKVMQNADRQMWRCDPDNHVEGITYEVVTRLLQGYIENEVDMSTNRDCMSTCSAYGRSKNEGCYMDNICTKQERCTGQIHDCSYAAWSMTVCPSILEDLRRYDYVEFGGVTFGRKGSCDRGETEVLSFTRYVFWDCSYCYCLCDDKYSSKTDRYFNLRETVSNVNENKVITGIRFVKENRIFHLQIQEGQLLARGVIKESSIVWKPIENYTLYDSDVKNNEDYYTLTYDNRAIDLDDIEVYENDFVLTGVRFREVEGHLNLQARLSQFDFETGRLLDPKENSYWIYNNVKESERCRCSYTLA